MVTLKQLGLEQYEDNERYQSYTDALTAFSDSRPESHVFVTGSLIAGELHEHSDIDCYVIGDGEQMAEYREERGGILINYVVTNVPALEQAIINERNTYYRLIAEAVSNWQRVKGDDSLDYLHDLARNVYNSPVPEISDEERESVKTLLDGTLDEVKKFRKSGKRLTSRLRANELFRDCINYYFKANGKLGPQWKDFEDAVDDPTFLKRLKAGVDRGSIEALTDLVAYVKTQL
jgi:hypothetical protein